jgi:uncharacterized paraquat-inducible protein A
LHLGSDLINFKNNKIIDLRMAAEKICFKCKFEGQSESYTCPRCGKLLRSKVAIRIRGAIMILLGGFLIAMMGGIISWAFDAYRGANEASSRFNGTPQQFRMIIGLMGLVFIFGLASAVVGLWQLIFGRRNLVLMWIVLGLGAVLVIAGFVVTNAL